jgi:hypothetical protein
LTDSIACWRCTRCARTDRPGVLTVPAIIFDQLPEDHIVQMFVTINAKHTRLNASHLKSLTALSGAAYRDDNCRGARRRPGAE